MTVQALCGAIDKMSNEMSDDDLFSELENAEYKEAFELFDKVSRVLGKPFSLISVKTKLSSAEASGVLFGRSFGRNPSAENTRSSVLAEASVMTEGSVHDRSFGCFWCQIAKLS